MSKKQCRGCGTSWTVAIYICPNCNSYAYDVLPEDALPIGREYKTIDSNLKDWYKKTMGVIKSMPKKD